MSYNAAIASTFFVFCLALVVMFQELKIDNNIRRMETLKVLFIESQENYIEHLRDCRGTRVFTQHLINGATHDLHK